MKKVIILIRTDQKIKRERRRNMLDNLEKRSEWISEKEKEKRRNKNKEVIEIKSEAIKVK